MVPVTPDPSQTIYCPRLGHPLGFAYCRRENMGLPCPRCLHCWTPYFPVAQLLREELSPEEWERCFADPGSSRLDSLMERIAHANRASKRHSNR